MDTSTAISTPAGATDTTYQISATDANTASHSQKVTTSDNMDVMIVSHSAIPASNTDSSSQVAASATLPVPHVAANITIPTPTNSFNTVGQLPANSVATQEQKSTSVSHEQQSTEPPGKKIKLAYWNETGVKVEQVDAADLQRLKLGQDKYLNSMKLAKFLLWAKSVHIELNPKVSGSSTEMAANFGMAAASRIAKGEYIFTAPRSVILSAESSSISDLLKENEKRLSSPSGWVPLLLALMYETLNPRSRWRPYLDAFPNFGDAVLPMFWSEDELTRQLGGTGMVQSVANDIRNMRKEFSTIVLPFIEDHPKVFENRKYKDFRFYKETAAFVMAYSFTDDVSEKPTETPAGEDSDSDEEDNPPPPPTVMVPMADLLNHHPNHNAVLKIGEQTVRMEAIRDIEQGEEIYNTYGQVSNYTLLLMYGFAVEPEQNPNTTVELPLSAIKEACKKNPPYPVSSMSQRWRILEMKGVTDDESFCLHGKGLTDDAHIINVFNMHERELKVKIQEASDARENVNGDTADDDTGGWISDDEEDLDLTFVKLKFTVSAKFQKVLAAVAQKKLDDLRAHVDSKTKRKFEPGIRSYYAKLLKDSQVMLLETLLDHLPKQ